MTTMTHHPAIMIHDPLQNQPVHVSRPPEPAKSTLAVDFDRPIILVKPPIDIVKTPDDPSDIPVVRDFSDVTGPSTESTAPPLTVHLAKLVQGGPGLGFPNPDDYYPTLARNLGEQGVGVAQVCVDPVGRLTANPSTLQSTGSARLDEAALRLAKAGSGHYRAATEDGHPVASCYPLQVRFRLRN